MSKFVAKLKQKVMESKDEVLRVSFEHQVKEILKEIKLNSLVKNSSPKKEASPSPKKSPSRKSKSPVKVRPLNIDL